MVDRSPTADAGDLRRFRTAQDPVWDQVTAELRAGAKTSHWMWFVFPQLAALGRSPTATFYGIRDREEAVAYLRDPVLCDRLETATRLLLAHRGQPLHGILGSPDDLKFRSCMTLFTAAAAELGADEPGAVFQSLGPAALAAFPDGGADPNTQALLAGAGG